MNVRFMLMSRKRMPYIESLSSMSSRSSAAIDRDLRHAESAGVVGEHDVAAELLADLVERRAHDAEVGLRRIRAAEAFGRRAERDEVEQRLSGRANDRDDLRAGFGRRDRRGAIFVDVAAGNDDVEQRRRQLRKPLEQRLRARRGAPAMRAAPPRRAGASAARAAASGVSANRRARAGRAAMPSRERRRLKAGLGDRSAEGQRHAAATARRRATSRRQRWGAGPLDR